MQVHSSSSQSRRLAVAVIFLEQSHREQANRPSKRPSVHFVVAWIDIRIAQREDKSAVSFNKQSFDFSVIVSARFMVAPPQRLKCLDKLD